MSLTFWIIIISVVFIVALSSNSTPKKKQYIKDKDDKKQADCGVQCNKTQDD